MRRGSPGIRAERVCRLSGKGGDMFEESLDAVWDDYVPFRSMSFCCVYTGPGCKGSLSTWLVIHGEHCFRHTAF